MLGDQQTGGTLEHERYDGAMLAYAYAAQSPFSVQGQADESVQVTLGDLADPNLAPMAAWNLSEIELNEPALVYHDIELEAGGIEPIETDNEQFAPQNGFGLTLTLTPNPEDDVAVTEETTLLDMACLLYTSDAADE